MVEDTGSLESSWDYGEWDVALTSSPFPLKAEQKVKFKALSDAVKTGDPRQSDFLKEELKLIIARQVHAYKETFKQQIDFIKGLQSSEDDRVKKIMVTLSGYTNTLADRLNRNLRNVGKTSSLTGNTITLNLGNMLNLAHILIAFSLVPPLEKDVFVFRGTTPGHKNEPPKSLVSTSFVKEAIMHFSGTKRTAVGDNSCCVFVIKVKAGSRVLPMMNLSGKESIDAELEILLEAVNPTENLLTYHTTKNFNGMDHLYYTYDNSSKNYDDAIAALNNVLESTSSFNNVTDMLNLKSLTFTVKPTALQTFFNFFTPGKEEESFGTQLYGEESEEVPPAAPTLKKAKIRRSPPQSSKPPVIDFEKFGASPQKIRKIPTAPKLIIPTITPTTPLKIEAKTPVLKTTTPPVKSSNLIPSQKAELKKQVTESLKSSLSINIPQLYIRNPKYVQMVLMIAELQMRILEMLSR